MIVKTFFISINSFSVDTHVGNDIVPGRPVPDLRLEIRPCNRLLTR